MNAKKAKLINEITKYKKEKESLESANDIEENIIKNVQREINNYKRIQNKYRQSCEDLTNQIYQLKEELSHYGKVYSKIKTKK